MLAALEARATARGSSRRVLLSAATARRFCADAGYTEDGAPECKFSCPGYRLAKTLPDPPRGTDRSSLVLSCRKEQP